ncbi:MAG: hypothetical protein WBR29_04360 [Gammaproteobacteria bacterium]
MNYPNWAPPILVLMHKAGQSDEKEIHIEGDEYTFPVPILKPEDYACLKALIIDHRMKKVWNTLRRHWEGKDLSLEAMALWSECHAAVETWGRDKKLTAREHRLHHEEIYKKCNELARLIRGSSLRDRHLIIWLPKDLRSTLIKVQALDYFNPESRLTVENLLKVISYCSRDVATWRILMKKPNAKKAEAHYFARRLSAYFKTYYQKPFHKQVITLTEVFLGIPIDTSIDIDGLKKLLHGSPPEHSLWRRQYG